MRKLIVSESLTMDGVFEAPAKIATETFEHAGWTAPYASEEQMKYISEATSTPSALLFGRVTYEHFADSWPRQSGPLADFMNNATKYVVSNTLKKPEWKNTTLITGNVTEEIARLKRESPIDLAVLGSGKLVQTLIEHDLVDDYALLVYPLVLGTGKRFFLGGETTRLKLKNCKAFSNGVLALSYEPERK